MKVFARPWRETLHNKYEGKSKYISSYIAKVALDPRLSGERKKIEKWFRDLPESVKPDILARIRSESSQQHFGAYYELVTGQFFKALGYSVEMHPRFGTEEPDLLISGKNMDKPVVVEVATVFDDPEWEKEDRKLREIVDQLDEVKHYFFLGTTVESTPIPEIIDYDYLRLFVTQWFDSFDPKVTEGVQKTQYDRDGLRLSLDLIPKKPKARKKRGSIIGAYGLPVRWISNKQLRNALRKKAGKYDFVKEQGLPYVVALSLYNTFSDNEDVIDQLFGKNVLTITRNQEGKVVSEQWARDSSGICKYNQNTRLSGVITIKSEGARTLHYHGLLRSLGSFKFGAFLLRKVFRPTRKPMRSHHFSLIHNPHAVVPLGSEIMRGYPQFTKTAENATSTTYSWIDEQPDLLVDD